MHRAGGEGRYGYPDAGDALTAALIASVEPYAGYWAESEERVLERVRAVLGDSARTRGAARLPRMLDAGCGDGRLIPDFAGLFERVTAIDPDAARLAGAAARVESAGLAGKVELANAAIQDFRADAPFDFILCSHVIQHVPVQAAGPVLARLGELLVSGGWLALLTTHSTTGEDAFAKDVIVDGEFLETAIGRAEFDRLAAHGGGGVLPIRFFARETLARLLADGSLVQRDVRCYHVLGDFGELERLAHRDDIANALPELQAGLGRDVCILADHG